MDDKRATLLSGCISRDQAVAQLAGPTADLGNAQLDLDRSRRVVG